MSLAPLLNASLVIQLHAFTAIAAFVLGVIQLIGVKGTTTHRALGYIWAALMLVIAISSFWIHGMRLLGPFSPIHLLSILVLVMLPVGILYARNHRVRGHKLTMLGLFAGALVIAGLFTLVPGRLMYQVVFGG